MTATQPLPAVEIEPPAPARAAVIWLHGLGADGHDFEPIVPHLGLPPGHGVRFVFPHAPRRPVTINNGMVMPAWYDITGSEFTRAEDEEGIRQSAATIRRFIAREMARGIEPGRIVLAGFSQGGAIALHTGLRLEQPLAGIMALSTYLPLRDTLSAERADANRHTPILMIHGRQDSVVPPPLAQISRQHLEALGHPVEWHAFDMGHSVIGEEIQVISQWLRAVLELHTSPE